MGKSVGTIRRWEKEGKLTSQRTPGGHRMYRESDILKILGIEQNGTRRRVAVYARVSTRKQREAGNLARQIDRLTQYAKEQHYQIIHTFQDMASGLNENRRQLKQLIRAIQAQEIDRVLVEYPDRLARYGYKYLQALAEGYGVRIEILEEKPQKEPQDELVEDLLAIVSSFAARIYGARSHKGKTLKQCVTQVTQGPTPD